MHHRLISTAVLVATVLLLNSIWPGTVFILGAQPPNSPTNLIASTYGTAIINLTWSDNSDDETGFRIERAKDALFATDLVSVTRPANATDYSDTQIMPATKYFYRVFAFNDGGVSPPSKVASAGLTRIVGPEIPPITADLTSLVDRITGKLTSAFEWTPNELTRITIDQATLPLGKDSKPVKEVTVSVSSDLPAPPPKDYYVLSSIYDFGPDGATFSLPVTILLRYDKTFFPRNARDEDIMVMTFDSTAKNWVRLTDFKVNTQYNTVLLKTGHFSRFAVMVVSFNPAAFKVDQFTITPEQPTSKDLIIISCTINNTGDIAGSLELTLLLENAEVGRQTLTLESQKSTKVSFTLGSLKPNTYKLELNEFMKTLVVTDPAVSTAALPAPVKTQILPPLVSIPSPKASPPNSPQPPATLKPYEAQIPQPEPAGPESIWRMPVFIIAVVVVLGWLIFVLANLKKFRENR